ncbi:MAG: hypothetical protein K9K38_17220 [Rhodoferax sp.]|nr:hypothetical protein [Rhodoferax sp.]
MGWMSHDPAKNTARIAKVREATLKNKAWLKAARAPVSVKGGRAKGRNPVKHGAGTAAVRYAMAYVSAILKSLKGFDATHQRTQQP